MYVRVLAHTRQRLIKHSRTYANNSHTVFLPQHTWNTPLSDKGGGEFILVWLIKYVDELCRTINWEIIFRFTVARGRRFFRTYRGGTKRTIRARRHWCFRWIVYVAAPPPPPSPPSYNFATRRYSHAYNYY